MLCMHFNLFQTPQDSNFGVKIVLKYLCWFSLICPRIKCLSAVKNFEESTIAYKIQSLCVFSIFSWPMMNFLFYFFFKNLSLISLNYFYLWLYLSFILSVSSPCTFIQHIMACLEASFVWLCLYSVALILSAQVHLF